MGKKLLIATVWIFLTLLLPVNIARAEFIAGSSAAIRKDDIEAQKEKADKYLVKKMVIKSVLESYNSPLASSVDIFLKSCVKYELDCYLLPSIMGVESYFGKYLMPNSYNPFGWGGGYIYFESWDRAIDTVASSLRKNYINKGADTVEKIGPIYATTTTWAPKVEHFIRNFEKEEQKYLLYFNTNKVEL